MQARGEGDFPLDGKCSGFCFYGMKLRFFALSALSCASLPAALVAHWEFNEPGLPTSSPASGSYYTYEAVSDSNTGRFWGAQQRPFHNTSIADSPAGGGNVWFSQPDGATSNGPHIIVSGIEGSLPSGGSNRTIAAWINPSSSQIENNPTIFSYGTNAGGQRASFLLNNNGLLRFEVQGIGINATGAGDLRDDEWHHVAMVLENAAGDATISDVRLYVDGVEYTNSSSDPTTINTVIGGFSAAIGNQTNSLASRAFTGSIDDVRVYDHALSSTDVAALAAVPEPSVVWLSGLACALGWLRRRR